MIKVLVVNTVTYHRNGITGVIFNLFNHIDKENIHMDFVATDDCTEEWAKDLITKNGCRLFVIRKSYKKIFSYIKELSKLSKDYDVIHVHGNSSSMFFELLAAKFGGVGVRIAHNHSTTCSFPLLDKLLRPAFYKVCNVRLACGMDAGKWLYGKRSFDVINNGIGSEKYRFNSDLRKVIRKQLCLEDKIVIGHVGRLNEQKNQTFLLDIFKVLSEKDDSFRLILIGDGPLENELKKKACELEIKEKVIFLGSVDNVNDYLNAIDIIVMPSLYEGLPLALIEEQANGLNCVVSDTVTTDIDMNSTITFVNLEKGAEFWVKEIKLDKFISDELRYKLSVDSIESIQQKGYDIEQAALFMCQCYKDLVRKFSI